MTADLGGRAHPVEQIEDAEGVGAVASSAFWDSSVHASRSSQLALLALAAIAGACARSAVSPFQETIRVALALSDNQMGLLQGPALALPVVAAAVPLGFLLDRHSRVRLLLGFAALTMLGSVLTALASDFLVLFAARCLTGLTASATMTAVFALLADLYEPEKRGRANMVVAIGQIVGTSAAFALGGALLSLFDPAPNGWRWAMLWLTSPTVLATLLLTSTREPARVRSVSKNPAAFAACVELWRYRAVAVPLLAGVVMVSIADCAAMVWAAPAISRKFALSAGRVGSIMATIVLVSGLSGAVVGGVLSDLCQRGGGPRRTMSFLSGIALLSIPASLFGLVPDVTGASVFLATFLMIGTIIGVTATTLATVVIPNDLRGLFLAVLFAFGTIFGIGLAPVTVSLLSSVMGGPALIGRALALTCAATSIMGAATFVLGRRHFLLRVAQTESTLSAMSALYEKAVRLTGPKLASQTLGASVEGYWIDEDQFYFAAERLDPTVNRVVEVPSIANCKTGSVQELIPLEVLASLLSDNSGHHVNTGTLSLAEFDMPNRDTLAVSLGGRDYLIDLKQRCVLQATTSWSVPALYSPDGRYACFVRGHDLWLKERESGVERQMTFGGQPHYSYGQQSETGLAAVSYRQRPTPVGLWSPDSTWFLTHRIDERSLPELPLLQHAPPDGARPALHSYKYPMPGDPLPTATYVAIHVASGRLIEFADFPVLISVFSPFSRRMAWFSGADRACCVRFDRYFRQVELICFDLVQETGCIAMSEVAPSGYIDLHPTMAGTPNVRTLQAFDEIIWYSERDGWGHLYLYEASTGKLKNQITTGEWLVTDIVHVDERARKILFLACGIDTNADPACRSLCSVNLDGTCFEVLLAHEGDISVRVTEPCGLEQNRPYRPAYVQAGISPGGRFGVVRYASMLKGNKTDVIDIQSRRSLKIASAFTVYQQARPRRFAALAADGKTRLHGVMFLPAGFDEARRYPLIDYVYPGPSITQQPQSFGTVNAAPAMALSELGLVTIMLDTRGVPFRSRSLHQAGYGSLLEPQLSDHAAVVRQLCKQYSFIDRERVGIVGHSAGGSAAARALFDYGQVYKVGIAVCGNHDPSFYSAIWSDRYRGPGGRETWAGQANGAAAHKLVGKLLLISGDMDENVHVSHTLKLVDALIRANKDFDLLLVPNAGHAVLMESGYVQRRMWDFLVRNLLNAVPPVNFEISFEPHEIARFWKIVMREARH
jgi:dipeptidyl-peptidase-4